MRGAWVDWADANASQRVLAFTNSSGPAPTESFRQISMLRKCPVSKIHEGICIWELEAPGKQGPFCPCENAEWSSR